MKRPVFALALLLSAALPAFAQEASQQNGAMAAMPGMDMATMGQHMMSITVTAIDGKTGMVDGTAGGMALKLHFPPPSLAGVKAGDKIMVHLSFHKV